MGRSRQGVRGRQSGHERDRRRIVRAHAALLAGYKVPRTIAFRDVLPISAAGKILKRELTHPDLNEEAAHES